MKKNDKIKRNLLFKAALLKILHIICYILSALFVAVCVIAGVKSCDTKPQSVSAEEDYSLKVKRRFDIDINNYFVYTPKTFNSNILLSLTEQDKLIDSRVDIFHLSYYYRDEQVIDFYVPTAYINVDNYLYEFNQIEFTLHDYAYGETGYSYLIKNIRIITRFEGVYHINNFLSKVNDSRNDLQYSFVDTGIDFKIIASQELQNIYFINYFFKLTNPSNFIFNQQFNYNAPLNTTIAGLYGNGSFTQVNPDSAYIIYDTGYFVSNGQLFNQIKLWFFETGAIDVQFSDGIGLAPSGYYVYAMMEYNNTVTGYSITVNTHDSVPYQTSGGGYTYYYANSSTWKNDSFRYITFLNSLSDSLSISINAFNNNNQSYYSGQIYSDGGDVFTLLSQCFSSLTSFWSINILPNISIGVLFFLPVVVGIIITIVHLLRK